jgi:hypothetical protein
VIEKGNQPVVCRAQLSIQTSHDALGQLIQSTRESSFSGQSEQINFYKDTLPFFQSRIIFYTRVHRLEALRPPGNRPALEAYFQTEWQHSHDFHAQHRFLYGYLRAGETWLDDKLFILPDGRLTSLANVVDRPVMPIFAPSCANKIAVESLIPLLPVPAAVLVKQQQLCWRRKGQKWFWAPGVKSGWRA